MKPGYIFYINGIDYTDRLQDRFIGLTLQDTYGFNNDRLVVRLDAVPAIQIPKRGAKATLFLGYQEASNMPKYEGMVNMGDFIFDESSVQKSKSGGREVAFHFHALATGGMWKETHNTTYDNQSLADIVEHVAQRNEMTPIIDPEFYGIIASSMIQRNESDQSFLTALGLRYGASFKVSGKTLLFAKVGTIQALSDTVKEDACSSWSWLNQSTSNYGAVVANVYNKDTGKYSYAVKVVRTDSGEADRKENARLALPGVYATEELANAAAAGRASMLEVEGHSFEFSLYRGNPKLKAETMIKTEGFYDVETGIKMPSYWHLKSVTHSFDKTGGYVTSAECDKPAVQVNGLGENATEAERKAANEAAAAMRKQLKATNKAIIKADNKAKRKTL